MRCCVRYCRKPYNKECTNFSFHKFPKAEWKRQRWMEILKLDDIKTSYIVCSRHFHECDFIKVDPDKKKILFPSAMPFLSERFESQDEKPTYKKLLEISNVDMENVVEPNPCIEEESFVLSPSSSIRNIKDAEVKCSISSRIAKKMPLKRAIVSSDDISSPSTMNLKKRKLKEKGNTLRQSYIKNRNIVHQKARRNTNKLVSLNEILSNLKIKNLVNDETFEILEGIGVMSPKLFNKKIWKSKGNLKMKQIDPALKSFAHNLNFLSPKAYEFVRENFDNCLPHPSTISKWYECIDCNPGFTNEAFDVIKIVVNDAAENSKKVILNIVFDEMVISRHIDWNTNGALGYTYIGDGDDSSTEATQILVFLVVCINQSWKIPVGYFPIASLDAQQKRNLITHCIENLLQTGAEVLGLTFNGASVNFTCAKLLGANLNDLKSESAFTVNSSLDKISVLPDPCHMIKLVRNSFAEIGTFKVLKQSIKWKYLQELVNIKEKHELHLGNKFKTGHIYFNNLKMNVSLVVESLNKSVPDAIEFCRDVLLLPQFCGSEATVTFLRNLNNIFDVLNKVICEENIANMKVFANEQIRYLYMLKATNGVRLVQHKRKTGFIGLITCLKNIKIIYERFVKTKVLEYVPFYNLNQDHIELFFDSMRSNVGGNDNPSVKQFKGAYKKQIIRCKIRKAGIGTCLPLENIQILNITSSNPVKAAYLEGSLLQNIVNDNQEENETFLNNHDYFSDPGTFTEFTSHVVKYIAGFVVLKLKTILNCDSCRNDLESYENPEFLIALKTNGFLKTPSKDVEDVCLITEKQLRIQSKLIDNEDRILKKQVYDRIIIDSQNELLGKTIFEGHIKNSGHFAIIAKMIIEIFLKTRHFYVASRSNKFELN